MIIAINYSLAIVRLFKHPSDAPSTQRRFTSKRFQGGFMVRFKAARVFSLAYLSRNWWHNTLNTNELYKEGRYHLRVEVPNASSLHKSQSRRIL